MALSSLLSFSLLLLLFSALQPTSADIFYSPDAEAANSPATTGEWRLLSHSIGIVAMHMQLLPGNHLLTFDRTDFGLSNLSFPDCPFFYLDYTAHSLLYDISLNTLTPLPLLSDPWCSSAALLPNGSLLQTGGFNIGDRRRVMGDMVILPTGEILILNGAAAGTAGWELAQEPVLYPVLYKPDRPIGYRFEVMNPSTTPRMYHSAAILDSFGRVLVGGSNPHVGYVFQNVTYPTDLSLEAYLPPYLDTTFEIMRPRRVVVGPPAEVGYGDVALVRFSVDGGLQEGMALEVVMIAPAFATHSVGMNQRMVVTMLLRIVQLNARDYMAEVMAPPSPEVAPPGFYMWFVLHGGVPSQAVWVRIRQSGAFF